LWTAVRVLEEHADLKARLARRAADRGMAVISASFAQGSIDARSQAERIRSIMVRPVAARRPQAIARGRKRRQS
jgi:hypothetical protein